MTKTLYGRRKLLYNEHELEYGNRKDKKELERSAGDIPRKYFRQENKWN